MNTSHTQNSFSVLVTIKTAWEKISSTKSTFWGVLLCLIFTRGALAMIAHSQKYYALKSGVIPIIATVMYVILVLLTLILEWGLIYLGIQRAMGLPIRFNMIKYVFSPSLFFKVLGTMILQVVIFLPVIICFILPHLFNTSTMTVNLQNLTKLFSAMLYIIGFVLGTYLFIRLYLSAAIVIAKKSNPLTAIKLSFKATQSNVWKLLLLKMMNLAILLISIVPLGIGVIWTIPYTFICYGVIYKTLVADRFG